MSPGGVRVGVMGEALSGGVHFKGNLMGQELSGCVKKANLYFSMAV